MLIYRIVGCLEKCGLFSDFQYDFRSSWSTADLLTVVSDRIARAFDKVWHAGLLQKLKSYGIFGQIFGLSSFLSNRQPRVFLDGKASLEYLVKAGVPQVSILGLTLFLLYINDLPDDVMCDIAIYADDTTLYSEWDQASDLCQQLELTSELESNGRDTVDWSNNLLCLTSLMTMVLLMWKWMGLFLKKNNLLCCWGGPSLLNWIEALNLYC